jgi:ubiquinone/menaquinone biosynthesis C-methylase UbiE
MTTTSPFFRVELEPPPWLYVHLARGPIFRLIYRRLAADLAEGLPPGARLLDVGTGPGHLLAYLALKRPELRLFGLDLSFAMIRRARAGAAGPSLAPLEFLVANAQALPFPEGIFDWALASFSLHNWGEPERGVRDLTRVLKPGGRAWIYEMNREASAFDLRAFAREEQVPFPLLYLGFKTLSWHHALRAREFSPLLQQAGASRWHLSPVHHLFWRGELEA